METLPIEVISHIMRFLRLEDRKRCSLVCRRFYSSLQDPVLYSRICCRLGIYDSPQRYMEVSKFVHRRSIRELHLFAQPGEFWDGRETSFWVHISDKFTVIDTLHLNESASKELQAKIISNIATSFPSVKTIKLNSLILYNVRGNERILSFLRKIPRLILVFNDGLLLRPYRVNLTFHSIVIKGFELTDDYISRRHKTSYFGLRTPLSVLTSFSSNFDCPFHFEELRVSLPNFKLSEIVAELCKFEQVTIKHLKVDLSSNVTEDESLCFYQISEFGLDRLRLYSPFHIHSWFSGQFLFTIVQCEKLELIRCFGKFDQVTLFEIFSYCPLIESVDIGLSNACPDLLYGPWIEVKFRKSPKSRLRQLRLQNTIECDVGMPFLESLCLLPFSLREFKLWVHTELIDPAIFINLGDCCPNIRSLTIKFSHGFRHSELLQYLLSKLGNLEYLSLSPFITFTNLSFPHLKTLMLSQEGPLFPDALTEIAHSFPGLKCLFLAYGGNVCNQDLRSALVALKDLEELGLGEVILDERTFDILSQFAPSLRLLKLSRKVDYFKRLVRKYQDKHPNVLVQISSFWL
ncbi:hypothetical protein HOLleu_24712 [Holothuria leucospilota]|uniref:F-box domain-containing protein n=1 Tax=Holothuria leucospilota TaxID=206669 RepID=A0A9Q1BRZ9_HOLLE|nr:hypothetical protein HOLleu_24712 [Holothuria leucospilota]